MYILFLHVYFIWRKDVLQTEIRDTLPAEDLVKLRFLHVIMSQLALNITNINTNYFNLITILHFLVRIISFGVYYICEINMIPKLVSFMYCKILKMYNCM